MSEDITKLLPAEVLASNKRLRPAFTIGKIVFSVQASQAHYCSPRESGLPLTAYGAVEVALWPTESPESDQSSMQSPRELGLSFPAGKEHQWEQSGVGGWIDVADLIGLITSARDLDVAAGGDGVAKLLR